MRGTAILRLLALVAMVALVLGLAACGGDDDGDGGGDAAQTAAPEGERGGTLTVLADGDVDFVDPGQAYYQFTYMVLRGTMFRTLMASVPGNPEPQPDLAAEPPQASEDGRSITVRLRRGVRFSPPVDREVQAKDVKYAIERGFTDSVPSGYASAYFGSIEGVEAFQDGDADEITGLQTPDPYTLQIELTEPLAGTVIGAFVLPLTSPVPEEYAAEFDEENPSTYNEHAVGSGAYMIENNSEGELTGYQPGQRITLVRNPNWNADTDIRPSYLDRIEVNEGNDDQAAASRRILSGTAMVNGDFAPPPAVLRRAVGDNRDQLELTPSGGSRYVSMNTTVEPFDDINVRKAVVAAFDREAMRLSRGGEVIGDIPTHFIPPGIAGFDESGGQEGFNLDFLANPRGDMELAARYMREAGYESGRYEGDETLLMVGTSEGVAQKAAETAQAQFEKLGFEVDLRLTTQDTMYTRFCGVPDANVAVCPNVGWLKDYSDPFTILKPTFDGREIQENNNVNWSELDVPAINQAMDRAATITDPAERAQAWAEINRMITEQAPAIPWLFDRQPAIRSPDVQSGINPDNALWDLSFTSLEQP